MYFLTIDAELLKDKSFTLTQKLILSLVYSYDMNDKECFASVRAIADIIGVKSFVSVSKNINDLLKRGLLVSYTKNHKRYLKPKERIYLSYNKKMDDETIKAYESFKNKYLK